MGGRERGRERRLRSDVANVRSSSRERQYFQFRFLSTFSFLLFPYGFGFTFRVYPLSLCFPFSLLSHRLSLSSSFLFFLLSFFFFFFYTLSLPPSFVSSMCIVRRAHFSAHSRRDFLLFHDEEGTDRGRRRDARREIVAGVVSFI